MTIRTQVNFALTFTFTLLFVSLVFPSVRSSFAEESPVIAMYGESVEFSSEPVDGVIAKIHISDVRSEMKKLNSAKTHLMAIRFFDTRSNEAIPQGHAALYLTNDHNKTGFFDPMKNRDGIFVAGLLLVKPGVQHVIIASKLLDRKTRDFHLHFTVE